LLNFLDFVVESFTLLFDLISGFCRSMISMCLMVQASLLTTIQIIGFLPGVLGVSAAAVLAIGVTKLILGWGNS